MKLLVVGPSDRYSRGGMATVINGIRNSDILKSVYDVDIHSSYVDGNIVTRLVYSAAAYLRYLLIFRRYDLIHIHVASYGSTFRKKLYMEAAKASGKKVIVHIHGGEYMKFYHKSKKKKKKAIISFLNAADLVIGLSDEWKNRFETEFEISNCVSLPNGIDTEVFGTAVCNVEQCHSSFVFLGRLGELKGAYDLIRAVKIAVRKIPNFKLYMAGDGEIDEVRALIQTEKLEKYIELLGWIGPQEKLELLGKCSVLVLPSYNEGLPMAILEAMASGKAIISTTVGAIPEVVKPENGILITPGDVNALAEAMITLSKDDACLTSMSENNKQKIDHNFSMKLMHKKLLSYYNEVLMN